jgi:hypothetical protein
MFGSTPFLQSAIRVAVYLGLEPFRLGRKLRRYHRWVLPATVCKMLLVLSESYQLATGSEVYRRVAVQFRTDLSFI